MTIQPQDPILKTRSVTASVPLQDASFAGRKATESELFSSSCQKEFWEHFWSATDRDWLLMEAPDEILSRAMPFLETLKPHTALDMGCGEGRNLASILRMDSLQLMTAADISFSALVRTAKRIVQQERVCALRFMQADCANLPFTSTGFDFVLASDLLNHLPRPEDAIGEFFRVLRPGGLLVCNPLSTNDPAFLRPRSDVHWVGPTSYVCPVGPGASAGNGYLMHFLDRERIVGMLGDTFEWVLPLVELNRTDPPHSPPFRMCPHEHVYWQVVCRRTFSQRTFPE